QRLKGRGAPDADKLAEDLRDFGRGDEITVWPERISRHVITVNRVAKAERNIAIDRHRTILADHRDDEFLERCRLLHVCRDRSRSQIPMATRGRERIMPMVMKP